MLLCFAIIFHVVLPKQKPVKAAAVVDDFIYLFIIALCEKGMIDIALNNENGQNLVKFFDAFLDAVHERAEQKIQSAIDFLKNADTVGATWRLGVTTVKKINNAALAICLEELYDYMFSVYTISSIHTENIVPTNADGYVGFTSDTAFTFTYPNSSTVNACRYYMNHSYFDLYSKIYPTSFPQSFPLSWASSNTPCIGHHVSSPIGLDYYDISRKYDKYNPAGQTFSLTSSGGRTFFSCGSAKFESVFTTYSTNLLNSSSSFYYDEDTDTVYSIQSSNNRYYLADDNGVRFDDRDFSSANALSWWFLSTCGYVVPISTGETANPYDPTDTSNDILSGFDPTKARDYIDSLPDEGTTELVVAGTLDQALEIDKIKPYVGTLSLPSTDYSMWWDKFPFCVPFDIVKLFTQFSATAEAPSFHILILPENSFGLDNDDIYVDLDFADYHILVKIVRLFLAAGFALWLLRITRKVIGA